MTATASLLAATAVLAAGTFALRLAGPTLRSRLTPSERTERAMSGSAIIMFAALVATATLLDGDSFAGFARVAGVAVGGLLALRRAPFVLVVLAAAATTACLRLLGVD
jgi:hypothetical protein